MPKLKPDALPSYRLHRQSGQAIVTLSGRDILLGAHGTKASRNAYDRAVSEWISNGRRWPGQDEDLSVAELIERFAAYRTAIYDAVSPEDLGNIMRTMVKLAKKGDTAAAKIVFERCAGKPQADVRHIVSSDEALNNAVEKNERLNEMLGRG